MFDQMTHRMDRLESFLTEIRTQILQSRLGPI